MTTAVAARSCSADVQSSAAPIHSVPRITHDLRNGSVDSRELRNAFGQFATGVTVITALDENGAPVGATANSFTSVSLDPALVLWCPGKHLHSLPYFTGGGRFTINVLGAEHRELALQFARSGADKFAGVATTPGLGGVPVLDEAVAVFECVNTHVHEHGDHFICIGAVERFSAPGGSPLVFHGGTFQTASETAS